MWTVCAHNLYLAIGICWLYPHINVCVYRVFMTILLNTPVWKDRKSSYLVNPFSYSFLSNSRYVRANGLHAWKSQWPDTFQQSHLFHLLIVTLLSCFFFPVYWHHTNSTSVLTWPGFHLATKTWGKSVIKLFSTPSSLGHTFRRIF